MLTVSVIPEAAVVVPDEMFPSAAVFPLRENVMLADTDAVTDI